MTVKATEIDVKEGSMRLSPLQIQKLTEKVFEVWKKQNVVIFKEDEKKAFARALEAVKADYRRESQLEQEVNKMLDDLERTNSGEFQRYKMFPLLKQKLAKERKIVL
jgi:hypothetical protein